MKTNRLIVACVLAATVVGILVSCGLLPISIETRISKFQSNLNGDRTQAYNNLVDGSPEYNANVNKADLWDAQFPLSSGSDTTPFTIVLDAYSDPLDVKATVTGPDLFSKRVKFVMVNTGVWTDDWRIQDILLMTGPSTWQSIFS